MNKNVLLIDHSLNCGGGQISLMTFLKLQKSFNFILIINLNNYRLIEFCKKYNIKYYKFDFQKNIIAKFFNIIFLFININGKFKLSLLYGNTFEGGVWCVLLKILFRLPFVFRARLAINKFNHGIVDLIIYKFSDIILANSNFVKSSFIERFGIKSKNKIIVVYNSVVSDFTKLSIQNRKFTYKNIYNIAIIGSIEENKGQLIAVKAIEFIVNVLKINNVRLLIIGSPDIYDKGKYYNTIKNYASNANLTIDNLNFLGYINQPVKIYDEIDLVINCHQFEALSRVMFETQLCGIPNVAANAGGNIELISHFETGLLFEPNDHFDLAHKVLNLLTDNSLYELISYNSNNQILNLFSQSNTLDMEVNILNKLVS